MTRPFVQLSPIASVGCDIGAPYSGLAGAVVKLALEDAKWGSKAARQWLTVGQGRRWVELLGGLGYLDAYEWEWQ